MRNQSMLVKMIVYGCILSVLPVVFLGAYAYTQSAKQVRERVDQAELQYVRQLNASIEQVLTTVDHTLTNLVESNVMDQSLYSPLGALHFQLYNHLKSEITHLQSFDTKVEDVIIVNEQQDWIVKNSGIRRLNDHPDRDTYLAYFELQHDSSWVLLDKSAFTDAISSYSCPQLVALVKKLPAIRIDKYGLAIATIPVCQIAQMMTDGAEAEEVIVLDADGQIMVHRDPEMIGRSLASHPVLGGQVAFEATSGQVQVTHDRELFTVTYYKSGLNGWTYATVVSIEQLTRESRQIGWLTLGISLGIILTSIVSVWLVSRRLYTPLNQLVRAIERDPSGGGAGPGNEIEVIERHITALFRSHSNLEREMRSHAQQVSALFLSRLYAGQLRQAEIADKLAYFGFSGDASGWKRMAVAALQVDTLEHSRYEPQDMELLLFAMMNIAEEVVPKGSRLPAVLVDRSLVLLLGSGEEEQQEADQRLYALTESLKRLIQQYLDLSVSIGISLWFTEMKQAARAYDEALEALKYRLRLGKGVIVPLGSVYADKPSVIIAYPDRTEHELIDAVKLADEAEALRLLHSWMEEAELKTRLPGEYQLALMRLLNRLLVLAQEANAMHGGTSAGYNVSMHDEVLALHVGEEIEEWFKDKLIVPLVRLFGERRDSADQKLSERIIDLIAHHYASEFTLDDCAAKLHYNASYLSNIFKKETNMTFSEYLAAYRLQMAKRWLTETDMTVKEIAERLKYTNSHNFIRAFRKQEDMTPGQYRSRYRGV
ncbi:AraC family transcriptional regulator [Paenibacillus sp. IB182496]|uniref:AraC family transcriptional regulator n=1 Tax=Paenibacillus sabuli TaxID=2772509 RepID=A0A927GPT1_9BACL|nr:helix-turn-helix domain-containing protein [Paenibacillus sabuli]MBD2843648.1 AraC family transcriptional regulator [Paenibacillus sabuli]